MPTLLYRNYALVKGQQFDSWRVVGSAMQSVKVYNMREVDELIFVDITATNEGREPDYALVDELADECFMPLTVGGGVNNLQQVERLLKVGADKVAINTAAVERPEFIKEVAGRFGSQCVVVSIDFRRRSGGKSEVVTRSGTVGTGIDPVEFARRAQDFGGGEILLTSVDKDGTMEGYDLEVTRQVSESVGIPVIASGGAGTYEHLWQALTEGKASAVASAAMYHFTEQTPLEAKRYLASKGVMVRL